MQTRRNYNKSLVSLNSNIISQDQNRKKPKLKIKDLQTNQSLHNCLMSGIESTSTRLNAINQQTMSIENSKKIESTLNTNTG